MARAADEGGGGSVWNSEFSLDGALSSTWAAGPEDPALTFLKDLPSTGGALGDALGAAENWGVATVSGPTKLIATIDGIAGTVLWIIEKATGRNLLDYLAKPFTGDWDACYRAADTWLRIAAGAAATSERMRILESAVFAGDHWTGVAATRSSIWMSDMASALEDTAGSASGVAVCLADLARTADEIGEAAGKMLETLIDILLGLLAGSFLLPGAGQAAVAAGSTALVLTRLSQILDLLQGLDALVHTIQGVYLGMTVAPMDA